MLQVKEFLNYRNSQECLVNAWLEEQKDIIVYKIKQKENVVGKPPPQTSLMLR